MKASSYLLPPQTMEDILDDFEGRRLGLIRALTVDVKEFRRQCDPVEDDLYLRGLPNSKWEVIISADNLLPPKDPKLLLGVHFSREGLKRSEWLSIVAASSDSWLLSVASYYATMAGFNNQDRNELFWKINNLQTVFDAFSVSHMNGSGGGNSSSNNWTIESEVSAPRERLKRTT